MTLYFDDPKCKYSSKFALLCKTEEEVREVDKAIFEELKTATRKILALNKQYPDAGIGDTATDEEIAHEFYQILHFESCFGLDKYIKEQTK